MSLTRKKKTRRRKRVCALIVAGMEATHAMLVVVWGYTRYVIALDPPFSISLTRQEKLSLEIELARKQFFFIYLLSLSHWCDCIFRPCWTWSIVCLGVIQFPIKVDWILSRKRERERKRKNGSKSIAHAHVDRPVGSSLEKKYQKEREKNAHFYAFKRSVEEQTIIRSNESCQFFFLEGIIL